MRSIGYDHVIDYQKEDFTKRGNATTSFWIPRPIARHSTMHAPSIPADVRYRRRNLTRAASCTVRTLDWPVEQEDFVVARLKPNQGLPYLCELVEAGQTCACVIDGLYRFTEVREAFRRYGAAEHKGKIVVTVTQH